MSYDKKTLEEVRSRLRYIYEEYNGWGKGRITQCLGMVSDQLREMEMEDELNEQ